MPSRALSHMSIHLHTRIQCLEARWLNAIICFLFPCIVCAKHVISNIMRTHFYIFMFSVWLCRSAALCTYMCGRSAQSLSHYSYSAPFCHHEGDSYGAYYLLFLAFQFVTLFLIAFAAAFSFCMAVVFIYVCTLYNICVCLGDLIYGCRSHVRARVLYVVNIYLQSMSSRDSIRMYWARSFVRILNSHPFFLYFSPMHNKI